MHSSDLELLLTKLREDNCSAEDLKLLRIYFSDRKNETEIKSRIFNDLENFENGKKGAVDIDFDQMYGSILARIGDSREPENFSTGVKKRTLLRVMKIAAVMIPVFLSGTIMSYIFLNNKPVHEVISFTEIKAPYGARSEVLLPDGSSVWLNAGSKIRYMNVFNKENRDIYLEGEGYFKVAKNKALPFNVKAGDLDIVALGTEFNVKSYADEGTIETTLVEGKISIRQNIRKAIQDPVYLEPDQKAVYFKANNELSVKDLKAIKVNPEIKKIETGIIYVDEEIDPVPVIAWKENRLILKGEELSSLLVKLERKYDVQFIFETDDLKQFRFSGTLENETLTQVLDVIKLSAPIEYELKGKSVRIRENKQMILKFRDHLKTK